MREKKQSMAQNLRLKCNELTELEKENKRAKSKMMIGHGQSGTNSSMKDTTSNVGSIQSNKLKRQSTNFLDPLAALKKGLNKNQSEESTQKMKLPSGKKPKKVEEEKMLEISMINCADLQSHIYQYHVIKDFYEFIKQNGNIDQLSYKLKIQQQLQSEWEEILNQLKSTLLQKPPKASVTFAVN